MANVSSNNLTTLYSGGGVNIKPTSAYGNSNVVSLLNAGTDGGNTVTNIVATGNITIGNITANGNVTADYFIGNLVGNTTNANYANYAGEAFDVNISNVTGIGNIAVINLDGNVSNILHGDGSFGPESGNLNANYANFAGTAFSVAGANVSGYVANATHSNIADVANSVAGANVTGQVSFAAVANSVAGANVSGYVANATHSNVADVANSVAGSNVSGQVANALVAGTVYTNAQPNITSVGTLSNLIISNGTGYVNAYGNGTVVSSGNITAPYFIGNVVGNISGNLVVPGTNTSVLFNQAGNAGASDAFQFNYATNVATITGNLSATNISGNGVGLSNLTGANVSGAVAFATTANSVALANVSGAGNIASVNLDGNVSNLLTGLGTFVAIPTVSSNANYANFAGTAFSVSVGNVSGIGNIATVNLDGNSGNILFGNGIFAAVPNVANVANANYANFSGTAFSVAGANVSGEVANANFASYANIASTANLATYATTANSVAGANVSGEVANANYASYANIAASANSVAVANVSGIGNIATINLDGNVSNLLTGLGTFVAIPTTSPNANFANFAGNVTVSSQPNITSTGNLISLNIDNGVAGSPTQQFQPNGISIGSTANVNLMANSSFVDIDYGNGQGGGNVLLGKSSTYLKARGNAASITAANVSDRVGRTNYMFYNGNANVLAAATQVNPGAGVTFNTNSNAITTAGQYAIITGNPSGDQGNANALSNQNLYTFDPFGRLTITQGAAGSTSVALLINTYGGTPGGANAFGQQIFFNRLRGNRDGNLSVQANDILGGIQFAGWNGNATFATRTAGIQSLVDSSYVANTANIPAGLRFQVTDNTTTSTHQFYANGNVLFNSGKTVTAGFYYGDGSNLTGVGIGNVITTGQINLNPTSNGVPQLNLNGNSAGGNTGTMTLNDAGLTVNINGANYPGGAPSFAFSTYQTGGTLPPQFYKRYGGTSASPTGVANGDQILNQYYQVYGDSGNTNMTLGGVLASVGNIASPGNISFNYQIYSSGNPTDKIDINFPNINLNGNVTGNSFTTTGNLSATGNSNIANLQLNRFQENVFAYGNATGTITPDFVSGSIQNLTLTGNITMNTLGNAISGRSMTLILTQDATGNRTLTSSMLFAGANKTLSTAASAKDIISVFYDGANYFATLSKGYA